MNHAEENHDATVYKGRQRNYELLGAPILLHRNEPWYSAESQFPSPPPAVSDEQLRDLQQRKRAYARWYLPMDFHRVRQVTGQIRQLYEPPYEDYPRRPKTKDKTADDNLDKQQSNQARTKILQKAVLRSGFEQQRLIRDQSFRDEQNLALQQEARTLLLRDHDRRGAEQIIPWYQQHDVNLFPARVCFMGDWKSKKRKVVYRFTQVQQERLLFYANERLKNADPAYLAPWQQASWMSCNDLTQGIKEDNTRDETSRASDYGNCLASFSCRCKVCRGNESATRWVLHPVGPLLEKIRLSHFATPGGREVWQGMKFAGVGGGSVTGLHSGEGVLGRNLPLDTEDTVLEIKQCGDQLFIARGSCYCTLFRVVQGELRNSPPNGDVCQGGSYILLHVERLDLRCFIQGSLSYRPRCLATHPRFGGDLLDAKVSIVLELENRNVCNTIRQYMVGEAVRSSEHTVHNLQLISDVQYSSSHPMVLWASARSYVRPLPTPDGINTFPRVGFGTSLFSIDLRSNKAIVQWSPSAEEFATEGVHSISSLMTDWDRENTALLSSISAKKTWELDMRMPGRAVCSWSLPHFSEGPGAVHDPFGIYGAGMILNQPELSQGMGEPIFAVNKTKGTTGIHLYQRPNNTPSFQCPPTETVFTPAVMSSPACVATSLLLPLPDVVGSVFTCGLASFRVPTRELFAKADSEDERTILDHAETTVCVVSSTNKGDIYVHPLLESASEHVLAKDSEFAPVGSASVPVPSGACELDPAAPFNWLPANLTNEYPVPSSAIVIPLQGQKRTARKVRNPWAAEFQDTEEAVEIKPSETNWMSFSGGVGRSVKLGSVYLDSQKEASSTTMKHLDNRLQRALEREMSQEKDFERSDLTGEIIEDAELDWTRKGYDSSDESADDEF